MHEMSLVQVNTQFLKMEILLDDSVDRKIELQIERGGTPLTVDLLVQDLHSVTPDYVLDVSGAVMHPLSYQQETKELHIGNSQSLKCILKSTWERERN
ncbi:hypothetical protein Vadar_001677 [Vaccinium darrowii]|uniref:Uncharacterized protein n=1 Tax=Vaccinium darrowii TaxID=229202 RepID=A0ACB7YBF7_9ERIC|nr:hypothetical protein Vadar_001677 [Vaccinium darrowii]